MPFKNEPYLFAESTNVYQNRARELYQGFIVKKPKEIVPIISPDPQHDVISGHSP